MPYLFIDHTGTAIRLTDERLEHILTRHQEMADQVDRIAETLAEPDGVSASREDPQVGLYYRKHEAGDGELKYTCVVVKKTMGDAFVLTAYTTGRIR